MTSTSLRQGGVGGWITRRAFLAGERVALIDGDHRITRERLAHFKCPARVEYVPELPRNATGKVLKVHLRRVYGGQTSSVAR